MHGKKKKQQVILNSVYSSAVHDVFLYAAIALRNDTVKYW